MKMQETGIKGVIIDAFLTIIKFLFPSGKHFSPENSCT
jgi:hypothetical protein